MAAGPVWQYIADRLEHYGQTQLLLRVSLSVIVHVPSDDCIEADPLDTPPSYFASTLRSGPFCSNVAVLPFFVTLAMPVNSVPRQQKR